jgi:hypothetical protein
MFFYVIANMNIKHKLTLSFTKGSPNAFSMTKSLYFIFNVYVGNKLTLSFTKGSPNAFSMW